MGDDAGRSSFYNACYYAFRCCTTKSTSCMRSQHIDEACESCLKNNAPRMVQPWCYDYASKTDKNSDNYDEAFADTEKAEGTCWPQPGFENDRVIAFAKECFDVISWCNLLCPRDGGNSNQHAMCKHCVIMDFQKQDPTIDQLKDQAEVDASNQAANEALKVTTILSNFTSKYKITA